MGSSARRLDHDELVQLIYDGADDPGGFHSAVVEIAAQLAAHAAQLLVIQNGTVLAEHVCHGGPESRFYEFFANWKDQDPRFAAALARPGVVMSDTTDLDRDAFERSAIFNEFLLPDDTYYTVFGNFPMGSDLVVAPAFIRPRRAGAYGADDVAKLTALMPHLRRATRLRATVQSLQNELADLRHALDVLPSAVAILDPSGTVIAANAFAEQLFGERGGIRTERGKLTASTSGARRELSAAIARAAVAADAGARLPPATATTTVTVPLGANTTGPSLSVVLFALRPQSELRERAARGARVLAVFHDPRRRLRLNPVLVATIHGLTTTEAALACSIAEGQTLAEFAITRGCTEHTARTHLKRILGKTGTFRQADLVRVLLTGAAMHSLP